MEFKEKKALLVSTVPFRVTSANADMNCRLRVGALIDLLIQAAITSADNLNAGFVELKNHNLFWVLSRLTIEINEPLTWYQSGSIDTWPKNVEKIIFLRDFLIKNANEKIVAKATSGWLAIDIDSKRPRALKSELVEMFSQLKDEHAISSMPEKLFGVKEGDNRELKTSYFDIDVNGHVTSSRYIDWMMDSFSVEFHKCNYPKLIAINYLNETRIHESIQIKRHSIDEKCYLFEGLNLSRNITAFHGKLVF